MKKKVNWILILQAWAMLWVVIGHSFMTMPFDEQTPWYVKTSFDIAYSFHMPLFIMVSGYLFYMTRIEKPMPYFKMLLDKLKRLGIPFVVFTVVAMLMKTAFSANMSRASSFSVEEFVNAVLRPYDGPMREFWFISVIMWCFAFMLIWKSLLKNLTGTICGLIITLASALFAPTFLNDLLCFPRFLHLAFYFFCGMVCCRWNIVDYLVKYKRYILVVSLILYLVMFVGLGLHNGIPIACTGLVFSTMLAMILDKYFPKSFLTFRDYTYQIFLTGIFCQVFVKILYKKDFIPYWVGYLLCIVIGLYGPVLLSWIIKKINWNPLCLTIGLTAKRKKI